MLDYFARQDREADVERRERRANERVRLEPAAIVVDRVEIVIVAPCGHPISGCRNTGTPNWQNRWTCGVCGCNFSR